jgi:hypothetical protein
MHDRLHHYKRLVREICTVLERDPGVEMAYLWRLKCRRKRRE